MYRDTGRFKTIPASKEPIVEVICDICGEVIHNGFDEIMDIEVSITEGQLIQGVPADECVEHREYDVCKKCFNEKIRVLMKFIEENNAS